MPQKRTIHRRAKRGQSVAHVCIRCGGTFLIHASRLHTRANRFCSKTCQYNVSLADRFWSYVQKTPVCWLWTGSTDRKGYGQLNVNGRPIGAHKIAWELVHGPMPSGKEACHNCPGGDNPLCVRCELDPTTSHIWAGTHAENMADAVVKGTYRTKLTSANVAAIKGRLSARADSQSDLAREYKVSHCTINDIARERTHRHIAWPEESTPLKHQQ